jgi:hypothetical protein
MNLLERAPINPQFDNARNETMATHHWTCGIEGAMMPVN